MYVPQEWSLFTIADLIWSRFLRLRAPPLRACERDEGVGVDSTDAANTMLRGAFWEDSLVSRVSSYESVESSSEGFFEPEYAAGDPRQFQIGSVLFQAAGV